MLFENKSEQDIKDSKVSLLESAVTYEDAYDGAFLTKKKYTESDVKAVLSKYKDGEKHLKNGIQLEVNELLFNEYKSDDDFETEIKRMFKLNESTTYEDCYNTFLTEDLNLDQINAILTKKKGDYDPLEDVGSKELALYNKYIKKFGKTAGIINAISVAAMGGEGSEMYDDVSKETNGKVTVKDLEMMEQQF